MGEARFMERVYLGPDTAKTLTVYPGEKLILQGTLPVESAADLEVTIQCAGRLPLVLHPTGVANPRGARIALPDNLEDGDWDVTVQNVADGASTKLPIKLRVGMTQYPRLR